jgi:hypothetical protein
MKHARHYHNTTDVAGSALVEYTGAAADQELRILHYFQKTGRPLRPSEVHDAVGGRSPLTSTRRAITNLTSAGYLEKLTRKAEGLYGRPEHFWQAARALAGAQAKQGRLF